MENFKFYCPTNVIFGKNAENGVGKEIKKSGGSRILIHYGGRGAKNCGLLDKVKSILESEGLFYCELGGVMPNPRLSKIREGIALSKSNQIDFILAIGGGSVIDSSKAIAHGSTDSGDVWDFFTGSRLPEKSLPIGVVLTIAASGSETSNSCVITNEEGLLKRSVKTELNRPKFAIMNPELTYSLPPYQTACGIVDIMMHTLDRYFSPSTETDFVDRISEALLQSVIRAGVAVMKNPRDYAARADLMWAGSVSHNGLTGTGKTTDFAPHHIEHELSGKYDVFHGAGLAAIWGHWARFVLPANPMKFAQYASRVWNISMNFEAPEKTALEGIEQTENFFSSIGMPVSMKELGLAVSKEDICELAEKATFFGKRKLGAFRTLGREEIIAILDAAK